MGGREVLLLFLAICLLGVWGIIRYPNPPSLTYLRNYSYYQWANILDGARREKGPSKPWYEGGDK